MGKFTLSHHPHFFLYLFYVMALSLSLLLSLLHPIWFYYTFFMLALYLLLTKIIVHKRQAPLLIRFSLIKVKR